MTALQKILYQRFYVFPSQHGVFEKKMFMFLFVPSGAQIWTEPSHNTEG